MKNYILKGIILLCLASLLMTSGCQKNMLTTESSDLKMYYFDNVKGELVTESISENFMTLTSIKEQVEYIIEQLKVNKTSQLNSLQINSEMPIIGVTIDDRIVRVYFSNSYNTLSSQERIGMRAAIVYSLTQLEGIDSVDFYIENNPLVTANGKVIGPITKANIKRDVLIPTPALTPYTFTLYFANAEGKLIKTERTVRVSEATEKERLLIEELVKGPDSEYLLPTLPSDLKVKEVKTSNGVCQIDLSFDTKSKFFTSPEMKELMIYSIVNSLTSIRDLDIKKVAFLVDGKSDIELTPNIDLRDTFERSEAYIEE